MANYSFTDVSASKNPGGSGKKNRIVLLVAVAAIAVIAAGFLLLQNNPPATEQQGGVPDAVENTSAVPVPPVAVDCELIAAPAVEAAAEAVVEAVPDAVPAVEAVVEAAEAVPVVEAIPEAVPAVDAVVEAVPETVPAVEVVPVVEAAAEEVFTPAAETVPAALVEALAQARDLIDYRRYQDAHAALAALLAGEEISALPQFRREVITELNAAARAVAFGKAVHSGKITHEIVSGDNLDRLARRNNTTIEAIAALNGITDHNRIMLGYELVILPGPWKAEVDLAACELTLFRNGTLFMIFTVGVGKDRLTPKGTFTVADRVVEPSWTVGNEEIPYGDPRNIIGTRWMPLKASGTTPPVDGIGIHGTNDNATVGKNSSNGCIRLSNKDVEELYMLLPINSEVIIR